MEELPKLIQPVKMPITTRLLLCQLLRPELTTLLPVGIRRLMAVAQNSRLPLQ